MTLYALYIQLGPSSTAHSPSFSSFSTTSGVQKGSTACIGSFLIAHVCSTKNEKAMFGLYENRDLFEP